MLFTTGDFKKAEKAFEYALKLDPDYATSHHWYAINYLVPQQRYDEAIDHINIALEIDPLSLIINTTAGLVHYFSGNFDEAIRIYESTVILEKNFGIVHHFASWAYAQKGMAAEAVRSMKAAILLTEESNAKQAELGCIYAITGDLEKAKVVAQGYRKKCGGERVYGIYQILNSCFICMYE